MMFKLPFAEIPGQIFIGMRTSDVLTHAWDLATATGQSTDLDPELATEQLAAVRAFVGPQFRGPGQPFGDEQPCSSAARRLINWRRSWAERRSENPGLAAAQHVDDRAEVQGAVLGGELGVDLGRVAAQRRRRTGRGHRIHRQGTGCIFTARR